MKKYVLTCLLALAAACAQAGIGLAELPGLKGDGLVTVYYPSSSEDRPQQRGPFALTLAWQGEPVRGNGRLVVISHGSGGAIAADLLGDPPGFDRSAMPEVDRKIVAFFRQHLLP
jgi:hypothetical protein